MLEGRAWFDTVVAQDDLNNLEVPAAVRGSRAHSPDTAVAEPMGRRQHGPGPRRAVGDRPRTR